MSLNDSTKELKREADRGKHLLSNILTNILERDGEKWKQRQTLFSWAPKSPWMVTAAMKLKDACFLEKKAMTNLVSVLKSRDITLLTKVHIVKAMVFPAVIYEL